MTDLSQFPHTARPRVAREVPMKTTQTLMILAALVISACTTEPGPNGSHDGAITTDAGPTGDSKIGGTDAASADGQTDKDTDSSVDSSTDGGGSTDIVAALTCPGQTQTTAQTEVFQFPEPRVEKDCVQPLAAKLFTKLFIGKDKLHFLADDQKYDCSLTTCQLFPQIWSSKYKPATEYHKGYPQDGNQQTATKEDLAEIAGFPLLSLYYSHDVGYYETYAAVAVMTCDDTKCEGRSAKTITTKIWLTFKLSEKDTKLILELTSHQDGFEDADKTTIYTLEKM